MWLLRFRVYALSVGSAPSRVSSLGKPGNPTLLCGCVVLRSRVCDLSVGSAPSRDSNLGKPRNPTLLYGCVAAACYRKDGGPPVKPRTSRIATTRTPREAPGSHYKPTSRIATTRPWPKYPPTCSRSKMHFYKKKYAFYKKNLLGSPGASIPSGLPLKAVPLHFRVIYLQLRW